MEEDIKILENIIVEYGTQVEDYKYYTVPVRLDERDIEALENLLKAYKEAESQLDLDYVDNNYVPKSKIEEKIEELNNYDSEYSKRISNHNAFTLTELVQQVLQELLEEE